MAISRKMRLRVVVHLNFPFSCVEVSAGVRWKFPRREDGEAFEMGMLTRATGDSDECSRERVLDSHRLVGRES
jgi:hypothetical protein